MCGILEHFNFEGMASHNELSDILDLLSHREPDYSEITEPKSVSHAKGFLWHKRLSIIDLSESGRQHFVSDCGNLHMVYNGEIYN